MKTLHTCIRVGDLDKSIEFYQSAFGYIVNRRKDFSDFSLVYLTLPGEKFELELTYNVGTTTYELGNGYGHLALEYDNLEELQKKHQSLGFNVTDIKSLSDNSAKYYFIKDPDGYAIEIIKSK